MRSNDARFSGFDRKGTAFLKGIAKNNSKAWFEAHRDIYDRAVLAPMRKFFTALEPVMLRIDSLFMADPRPGKGITRPHRDTRFSKDKSPYKSTIWLTYRRNVKDWQALPAYYFEIMERSYRYGAGFFLAQRPTMDALRRIVDADPSRIRKMNAIIRKHGYSMEGDMYARPLKELPDDLAVWYNRKNLYLIHERCHDEALYSAAILDEVSSSFKALAPLYGLFMEAAERKTDPRDALGVTSAARNSFDF